MDNRKSVNTGTKDQAGAGGLPEDGRGAIDAPLHDGTILGTRAVPGAEVYHLEKKVNTESFFVRLFRSTVSCLNVL